MGVCKAGDDERKMNCGKEAANTNGTPNHRLLNVQTVQHHGLCDYQCI